MPESKPLRLIAQDAGDLEVISAAVQDAVAKAGALKYQASQRRFSIELNRFRWEDGAEAAKSRVRALLAFDSVLSVKARGITKTDPEMVISLLSVTFNEDEQPPGGVVTLLLAGDGELALTVEVLDATLLDSDYVWPTRHQPSHEPRGR